MTDYLLSTKNYEKLLLIDTNTFTNFVPKYISGLDYPEFTRYLVSENRNYTKEKSYLYKTLEGEEIDINDEAMNGRLELVKYMHSKDVSGMPNTKLTSWGVDNAAENGHLEVLKYFYISGTSCGRTFKDNVERPKCKEVSRQKIKDTEASIDLAARYGHLKVVKYLYNKGLGVTKMGISVAAIEGNLEVVKYLYSFNTNTSNGTSKDNGLKASEDSVDLAAMNGHLEVVKYLSKGETSKDNFVVVGSLKTTSKVYRQKIKATQKGVNLAAAYGHLEVVKYLYYQGLKATKDGIRWAARDGHLEVVKFLKESA
jgi:hypothetical protein